MFIKVVILAVIMPTVEVSLLYWYSKWTSGFSAFMLLLLSTIAGLTLIRVGGLDGWQRAKKELWEGRTPDTELMNELVVFLAGLLLFIPGPVTDLCGVLLLIPTVRRWFVTLSRSQLRHMMEEGHIRLYQWRS